MRKILLIALLLLCNLTFAQDKGTVTGTVTDKELNNEPLPFANVFIKGTSIGTTTDLDGKYTIAAPIGNQVLVFSFVGYKTIEKPISVVVGKAITINQVLGASGGEQLEEVQINATVNREKESALLLEQKKAAVIKESIGAQELAKKGVSDAAAAVSKISGVSKQEGSSNVYVRGLGDRYLNTTLNGLSLPSNNISKKNIDLSLFPSDIIQNVSISKAYNSIFYSDFAAGNIDITSKEYKGKGFVEVEIGGSANSRAIDRDDFQKTDGSGAFGFYGRYGHNPFAVVLSHGFTTRGTYAPINSSLTINAGKSFDFKDESRLSFFATASFSNKYEYREGPVVDFSNTFNRRYPNSREYEYATQSTAMLSALYKINGNHKLKFTSLFLNSSSDQVGEYGVLGLGTNRDARNESVFDGGSSFQKNIQFNQDLIFVNQITGKHKFSGNGFSDELKLDWGVGYNNVIAHEPDRKRINLENYAFALDNDPTTNPVFLTNNSFDNQRYFQKINDEELNSRINLTYKTSEKVSLNFGYNGRLKLRNFENQRYGYNFNDASRNILVDVNNLDAIFNIDNTQFFRNISTGKLYTIESFRTLPGYEDSNFVTLPGLPENTYEGELQIHAGYISAVINANDKWTILPGIRLENVNQSINYDVINLGVNGIGGQNASETFVLPSLSVKYALNDDQNLRFNFSKTVSIPEFKEVAPFVYEGVSQRVGGNPDLLSDPSFSNVFNLDLKYEWFVTRSELVSLAVFGKQIDDPVNLVVANDATGTQRYFRTGDKATVVGIELETKKNIIVNSDEETQLSAGFNFTYMNTDQDLQAQQGLFSTGFDRTSDKLQGASDILINANVTYSPTQFDNYKPVASLVFSYFSDRIDALGSGQLGNIVEKSVPVLDLIWKNKIGKNWEANLTVKNLLDPSIQRVREGTSFGDVILSDYQRGITAGISLKYKF
ncbi:TonB-dependent receptor [Tenacibaculum sp. M341]|uniref:TonB-dependent receptor n=1 Tax=Tenacibaculum sp. M341 TaxID=2530339 RepID=UPI0010434E84|nr:TonB-dependent receptor [Tenacibaculum sp. M341]TCI84951.1 TonB-dependent receptor [Tenacibaculum sp. M341]